MRLRPNLAKAIHIALVFLLNLVLPLKAAQANNVPIAVAPVMVHLEVATDIPGVEVSN